MLAIRNVTVADGTGTVTTLLIENGTIVANGKDAAIPAEAGVIAGEGLYVLPGFIDAHTHMGGSSAFDHPPAGSRHETYGYIEAREGFLNWGVTAVRSCGDRSEDMLAFRADVRAGKERSPRLVCCGPFFQAENGHPWATVYMKSELLLKDAAVFVGQRVPGGRRVAAVGGMGVDFIKVFYAHLNKMDYPNPVPRLTKEQLKRVVDSAHRSGLKCAVHVDGPAEMMDAAEAGADFIEHMIGAGGTDTEFTDEMVQKVKDSGAVVDPTMISILRFDNTPGFPSVWEALKKAVKQFYDAGIPLAVGCDSGIPFVPFGESLHDEMACLNEAGIPAADILKMVSRTNARVLGLEDQLGSLEVGKKADIVLLGSDPVKDIHNTRDIRLVLLDGHVAVDRMG